MHLSYEQHSLKYQAHQVVPVMLDLLLIAVRANQHHRLIP
ncbi:hypothetical protein THIOSC15_3110004 [uncultured Thiomicrorhabdus sp.]